MNERAIIDSIMGREPEYAPNDPRGKSICIAETARVQREVADGLRVWWDFQREKYVITDTRAPGGPDASYVMVVQEPDGAFRPFDQRTIDRLRYLFDGHGRAREELAKMERQNERDRQSRIRGYGEQVEDTLKFMGQRIVTSVSGAARRAEIRREAGL